MPTSEEDLDLIMHSLIWRAQDESHFEVNMGGGVLEIVPDIRLQNIHPLLPWSLRANIRRRMLVDTADSVVSNTLVKSTYTLLTRNPINIIDRHGNSHVFSKVFNLWENASVPGSMCLRGEIVIVDTCDVRGVAVPIVLQQKLADVYVSVDFLENQFPGWRTRWTLAEELGLPLVEQMKNVFDSKPVMVDSPSMTGLTFD